MNLAAAYHITLDDVRRLDVLERTVMVARLVALADAQQDRNRP